ncbi:MAG: MopE-related protein [Pseudomonadota bacterium]
MVILPLLLLAAGCALDLSTVDADGDGYAAALDCDDADPDIHPGLEEHCDGRDEDCDGRVDELAVDGRVFYPDRDGDGHGVPGAQVWACAAPPESAETTDDCDDADPAVHPGAPEVCDGRDQDCDGVADEGPGVARRPWYADADGDGFGDPATAVLVCGPASWGYVRDATDCDDAGPWAARTYPGAARWESATACMQDADGDGWGDPAPACPAATPGTDCDDVSEKAPYTFPGSAAYDAPDECTLDQDGDGYGADRPVMPGVEPGRDCCDACPYNWQTYPGAAPLDSESACMRDHDGDGYGDASPGDPRVVAGTDCDDVNAAIWPGVPEVCDGKDQDCDGVVDDGLTQTWYTDHDGDGFGNPLRVVETCSGSSGLSADPSDCDDYDAGIYPGRPEVCDGRDQDCDGRMDEGTTITAWPDADGDGYGANGMSVEVCSVVAGVVAADGDCDDGDATIHPGASEWCNGVDDDCDGDVDVGLTWIDVYPDLDGDGWGETAGLASDCLLRAGYSALGGDCDEANARIHPGATETHCDGIDQDCSGDVDACAWLADHVTFTGEDGGDYAGGAVAGAGDVDGDGLDDLLIGAPGWNALSSQGVAYLVRGSITPADALLSAADMRLIGDSSSEQAGAAVAGVGDVDGDGLHDLLIGAPHDATVGSHGGQAYLVLGRATLADLSLGGASAVFTAPAAYQEAGASLAGAGDVDGDGLDDLLIGAPLADLPRTNVGAAYLVLGTSHPPDLVLSAADATFSGSLTGESAGTAVAGIGDVDGDGLDDLLIGAPFAMYTLSGQGAAYLVLGTASPAGLSLAVADAIFTGERTGDAAGGAVAGAGDVDGDGLFDLLIGAAAAAASATSAGQAYLVLGSAGLATATLAGADATFEGDVAGDEMGAALAGAGDVDGDGFADLLFGAPQAVGPAGATGAAYLVPGGTGHGGGGVGAVGQRLLGTGLGEEAGCAVAGAGDVDGDGLGDLLVGAQLATDSASGQGAAYLLLGASL